MNKNKRQIRFRISDLCNYNCSYCTEHSNGKYTNFENIDNLVSNIRKLYNIENRYLEFFIYGGEPLLAPYLNYFINKITKFNFVKGIEIHSNLSTLLADELKKQIEFYNIKIATSIHPEYIKNGKIPETQLKNILYLNSINALSEINVMLKDLKELNKMNKIKSFLKNHNVSSNLIPTFEILEKNTYRKVSILLPELKVKEFNLPRMGEVNFTEAQEKFNPYGLGCNCPKDSFILNYNGEVLICQEDLRINRTLGINLFDKNINLELLTKSCICIHNRCRCEYEVKKWEII